MKLSLARTLRDPIPSQRHFGQTRNVSLPAFVHSQDVIGFVVKPRVYASAVNDGRKVYFVGDVERNNDRGGTPDGICTNDRLSANFPTIPPATRLNTS